MKLAWEVKCNIFSETTQYLILSLSLYNTLYYHCKTPVEMWQKERDEWVILHSVLVISQHIFASTVFTCSRCQILLGWTWDLYGYFTGETSLFQPFKCSQEVLPVCFWFMIILILCETFKILKLRSCFCKALKCAVECVKF